MLSSYVILQKLIPKKPRTLIFPFIFIQIQSDSFVDTIIKSYSNQYRKNRLNLSDKLVLAKNIIRSLYFIKKIIKVRNEQEPVQSEP